jgi:biotin synthase-like enzyme
MTDLQLLIIALAIILPVSALIVSDGRESLRAEIQALRTEMKAIKIHELEHHK